jgi:hypothetical protein
VAEVNHVSHTRRSPDQDEKLGPSKYEAEVLSSHSIRSVDKRIRNYTTVLLRYDTVDFDQFLYYVPT